MKRHSAKKVPCLKPDRSRKSVESRPAAPDVIAISGRLVSKPTLVTKRMILEETTIFAFNAQHENMPVKLEITFSIKKA